MASESAGPSTITQHRAWWKEVSVYQIYPSSFKDSNGTGVGDLKGVISKLDYLQNLGVDVVWLSPIFEGPKIDMGYDISDYRKIDVEYGDIEDVDALMHGSAWEYDEHTQEYYLRLFCREQPDLNWDHPPVRAAVHEIMHFWLSRGIDGFRMDVINFISKDPRFLDSVPSKDIQLAGCEYYACGPQLHRYLGELGTILKQYDSFSVGEMPFVRLGDEVAKSVGWRRNELAMIFHFELVDIDYGPGGKFTPRSWELSELKSIVEKWQHFMYQNHGWNAIYLENHDQPRSNTRFTNSPAPEHQAQSAKMLAIFQGFQAGTPFIYQGQEIGMVNVPEEWEMEEYLDIDCLNHWKLVNTPSTDEETKTAFKKQYLMKSRDNARTPMQWDSSPHAGFTIATPWMKVHPNHKTVNAKSQIHDPESVYSMWANVLDARKKNKDVLIYGNFELVDKQNTNIFAYKRQSDEGEPVIVACNFTPENVDWDGVQGGVKEVLVSNSGKKTDDFKEGKIALGPYEAFAVRV
ncbi:hypothetical protein B7494_g438 [Chlorociboria aeruginascens]|nr:hypothetical protein B7494_g438 [Chlorociboria aeruginascens]